MELLQAIILGIIQGLTEFIPVSSSGHLVLVPAFFGWEDQGLAFDAGLHVGTLAAVLLYFRRDWLRMGFTAVDDLRVNRLAYSAYATDTRLLGYILVGTIPAAIVGLAFDDWIEANLREPWIVAVALAVAGTAMLLADLRSRLTRTSADLRLTDAILIGCAQAVALVPGVSRSGATIAAGLELNMRREDAARFAFLLGTPAFAGAALLTSFDLGGADDPSFAALGLGIVTAAVVGFAAIHYLLRFLRTRSLVTFVVYRYVLAGLTLALVAGGLI